MNILIKIAVEAAKKGIEFTTVALATAVGQGCYVILDTSYHSGGLDGVPFVKYARRKEIEMYGQLGYYDNHDEAA